MSKGSTKVDAPDPFAVAQADATFNRIDQFTPFGNLVFSGPHRNRADLTLNPALADLENRRLLSDRFLLDTALSRQADIAGGSLPSLTGGIDPGALESFFSLPSSLQQGTDAPISPPRVPDAIGGFNQSKGGAPAAPPSRGGKFGQGARAPSRAPGAVATGAPALDRNVSIPDKLRQGDIIDQGGVPVPTTPPGKGGIQGGPFGGSVGSLIDPATFGRLQSLDQLEDFDIDRGRVEQAVFDRTSSLLQPQFDLDQERLEQRIANQGLDTTGEAAERLRGQFQRERDDTLSRLADQSVITGGAEQSRLFDISSSLGDRDAAALSQIFGFGDLLGQRDIQAQLQQANIAQANRATQFNELASLLGLQQVAQPGLNSFFAPANADVTGAFALNQQAQAGNANRAAGQKGGILGAGTDLGVAALGK